VREGLKGFIHHGRGRPLNLGNNVGFREQAKGTASDSNRNTHTGELGRVQRGPIKGETTLLVVSWQGPPFPPRQIGVPFKDVTRMGVQPPNPFCIIESLPKSKWAS